jgi:hypothetical protein
MFPNPDYHIVTSLKKNLAGGMQANRTDFFLYLQLNERHGEQRASGEHTWTMSDLDFAFWELQPKRAIIQPEPSTGCVDGLMQQFLKMDKCMDLVRQTEAEEGFRYDFVVRTRPDIRILRPMPSVWTLKRAAYVMPYDTFFYQHRDFADAAMGATRYLQYEEPVDADCGIGVKFGQVMASRKVCGEKLGPECVPMTSLLLGGGNVTVVSSGYPFGARVVRDETQFEFEAYGGKEQMLTDPPRHWM